MATTWVLDVLTRLLSHLPGLVTGKESTRRRTDRLLYVKSIEIEERDLGPDRPDLATSLNHRAILLQAKAR